MNIRAYNALKRYGINNVNDLEKALQSENTDTVFSRIGRKFIKDFYRDYDNYIQENENMANIDFKALKNARKAIEDEVEENIPEELESSYTSVWGAKKETVTQIEVTRLVAFTDEEGNTQPFKLNRDKVEQIKASAADVGIIVPLRVRRKGDIYEIECLLCFERNTIMIEQIILCALVDIISLFALHMSSHMNAQKKYYKSFFYPAFAATWLLIGRLDSLKAQIAFTILNLIAYFVIHSLSTKKELQNTV